MNINSTSNSSLFSSNYQLTEQETKEIKNLSRKADLSNLTVVSFNSLDGESKGKIFNFTNLVVELFKSHVQTSDDVKAILQLTINGQYFQQKEYSREYSLFVYPFLGCSEFFCFKLKLKDKGKSYKFFMQPIVSLSDTLSSSKNQLKKIETTQEIDEITHPKSTSDFLKNDPIAKQLVSLLPKEIVDAHFWFDLLIKQPKIAFFDHKWRNSKSRLTIINFTNQAITCNKDGFICINGHKVDTGVPFREDFTLLAYKDTNETIKFEALNKKKKKKSFTIAYPWKLVDKHSFPYWFCRSIAMKTFYKKMLPSFQSIFTAAKFDEKSAFFLYKKEALAKELLLKIFKFYLLTFEHEIPQMEKSYVIRQ